MPELSTIVFYVFSAILLLAASRVISVKNPVHAALFLVLAFFSASALWMLLKAEFLAIALVLVYVGAVMVLFLFVVMMLDINFEELRKQFRSYLPVGLLVGAAVLVEMVLVDVDKRDGYLVSQPLGRDSKACRADPQGFARASMVLRSAAAEEPDLVVCNRFGKLEAEGGGFSAELLEILSRDIPLLTVVSHHLVDDWQRFTGGEAQLLPPTRAAVDAWLARTLA
jgi:NADH:ubiquinone oxidoreductase subunit 6 (subunit J)